MRLIQAAVVAGVLAVTAGCSGGGSDFIPTTSLPATATFDGTLVPGTANIHTVTAGTSGPVTVTLTKAGPPDNIAVLLGIGAPLSDGSCSLVTIVPAVAASNPQISGSANSRGDLCIAIFDDGVLSAEITYSLTVVYPS